MAFLGSEDVETLGGPLKGKLTSSAHPHRNFHRHIECCRYSPLFFATLLSSTVQQLWDYNRRSQYDFLRIEIHRQQIDCQPLWRLEKQITFAEYHVSEDAKTSSC